jgi:hypothetical protein
MLVSEHILVDHVAFLVYIRVVLYGLQDDVI